MLVSFKPTSVTIRDAGDTAVYVWSMDRSHASFCRWQTGWPLIRLTTLWFYRKISLICSARSPRRQRHGAHANGLIGGGQKYHRARNATSPHFTQIHYEWICVMLSTDVRKYVCLDVTKCIVTKLQTLQTSPLSKIYRLTIEIDLPSDGGQIRHFGRQPPSWIS
jgi:hypothetical protein